jgi:hypothetical protein
LLGEGSFLVAEGDGPRTAQARIRLDPGRYALTVLVADPQAVRTGLSRSTVDIPDRSDRLRFSDVIRAAELDSLPYASMSGYDEPFIVGPFRVVPQLDDVVRRGEPIRLFYEVYGATLPLTIGYLLEGQESDGNWAELGRPQVGEQSGVAQGWELQTGERWPLGAYRIRIEVQDGDGKLISTRVPSTLVEPESN